MAATLTVIAAIISVSLAPYVGAAGVAEPASVACQEVGQVVKYEVSRPGAVTLSGAASCKTWVPSVTGNSVVSVGLDQQCSTTTQLSTLCPGATGTLDTTAKAGDGLGKVTFTFPQLPSNTTMIYMGCSEAAAAAQTEGTKNGCGFTLTVKGYSPEGPQACAVPGSSIQLAVQGEGGKTVFTCGEGLTLSPTDPKRVYGGDCTKEEDLKDLQLTKGSDGYYTLLATKKPSEKKLCYMCAPSAGTRGQGSSTCAVLITVSAGSGLAAHSTFGLALSCALALLHLA